MSAPNIQIREVVHLKYELLAAKAVGLIDKLLEHQPVTADEKNLLSKAEEFLEDVASGAALVSTGVAGGAGASQTVDVLGYALSPIQALQEMIGRAGNDVPEAFRAMSTTLRAASAGENLGANKHSNELLSLCREFFNLLYNSLLSSVEQTRLRSGPMSPGTFRLPLNAI